MSSFSSVVRKGPKVAPRIAPRRNIVRKAHPPASTPENPIVVESETAVDPPLPIPPTIREDADTQLTKTVQETTTPTAQQETQSNDDRTSDVLTEPARRVSTPTDPPTEPHTHVEASATTTTEEHTSTSREPTTVAEPHTTTAPNQETNLVNNASDNAPQPAVGENIEESAQVQETPEVVTQSNNGTQAVPSVDKSTPTNIQSPVVQAKPQQRRKRKQPPRASPHVILSQPSVSAPSASPPIQSPPTARSSEAGRVASRAPSVTSQQSNTQLPTPGNEFDRISSQLQTVQEASAAINARTRSARRSHDPSAVTSATTPTATEDEAVDQANTTRPRKRRKPNRSRPQTAEEQAAEVIANVVGNTEDNTESANKRPRGGTPEDAEEHEIIPESTKMGDLCEDRRWGKKSETEKEMAANWEEIIRRRKEDAEERLNLAALGSRRKRDRQMDNADGGAQEVVGLHIDNGVIVATGRVIDRHAQLGEAVETTDQAAIREDKDIYKRVLATTIGCRNPIAPGQTWDDLSTELFYTGLKKFGTDFQMISATIPGKTRKQVKLKYNVEERKNWPRVKRCLGMKEEVNLEEYAESTGVTFASVAEVYKQMEEDEKRLREEDEQRRRDEGIISQDQDGDAAADGNGEGEADVAIPSIETGAEAAAREIVEAAIGVDRRSTASRVGSTTTARQTAQPTGKKKQTGKKNAASSKKGKVVAAKNKGFEGVEERIGGIEEVAR